MANPLDSQELKNDIKKDVERTFQDNPLFHEPTIVKLLTNILFVWSKINADISYR